MRNKIVLVPFPFDDFSSTKVRPCICLTDPIGKYEHIVVAFISSKIEQNVTQTDVIIEASIHEFEETGLLISSVIKLHRLTAIPIQLIKRELGNLPAHQVDQLKQKLKTLFQLS